MPKHFSAKWYIVTTFYYYSFSCRIRIVACGFGLSCFN